ncbi:MAG: hypothetical protein NC489_19830 [Ruminococcus flavefaciens]|nr:hypothetical protein [Ruminococcus flavefaciens]
MKEHGYGHEEFNFWPRSFEGEPEEICLGFVEPKSNRGRRNTFHLENIEGCAAIKDEPFVEDVLVVWCATRQQKDTTVVGWYKHATVWRDLQPGWILVHDDGEEEERSFNVMAKASDCVLLPEGERNRAKWSIPSARYTRSYGFGQSMVWYPTEESAKPYLARLLESINGYREENWLRRFPD